MNRLIVFSAAVLLSSAVLADTGVFRWSERDLASSERIAALHQRAQQHARNFCRAFLQGTPGTTRQVRCVHEIVREIVSGVDDRRLTSLVRTGRVDPALLASR